MTFPKKTGFLNFMNVSKILCPGLSEETYFYS